MAKDIIFPLTFSGIRPGDDTFVTRLLVAAGLSTEDLNRAKLAHFIVARKGDTIVGVAGIEPTGPHALLRSVAVAPDRRGRGIATRLVAAIERYARSQGIAALYLLTTTAGAFFSKQGYGTITRAEAPEPIQATEAFRTLCPASARCLMKSL